MSLAAYDGSASSVDRFLYDHPDFISIFAAGNYGADEGLPTTVTSPATAKNSVAVGATLPLDSRHARKIAAPVAEVLVEVSAAGAAGAAAGAAPRRQVWRVLGADWPPSLGALFGGPLRLVAATDAGAACAAGSGDAARGGVLVAIRGAGCDLATKIRVAAAAGAAGLLLAPRNEPGFVSLPRDAAAMAAAAPRPVPVASMPLAMAQRLLPYLVGPTAADTHQVTATFLPHDACSGCPNYEDIAAYSSYGPTQDARIKPDVVAPGEVTSAASDGRYTGVIDACPTLRKKGTSMATPVAAGNAAIARQYFADGFYPNGERSPGREYVPSGVLLKAVLLGGASNMIGYTEVGSGARARGRAGGCWSSVTLQRPACEAAAACVWPGTCL